MSFRLKWFGILRILSFLTAVFIFCSNLAAQDVAAPIREIDDGALKIIEGSSYCSAGYGMQTVQISIGGQQAHNEEQNSFLLPFSGLSDIPALSLQCLFNRVAIDWVYLDDTIGLSKTINYQDLDYNALSLKHNAVSIGYSFPIITHELHLNLGIGYSMTEYSLGYFEEANSANDRELTNLKSGGMFLHSNLKLYLSPALFIHWTVQNGLGDDNLVKYFSQLGISFFVKL